MKKVIVLTLMAFFMFTVTAYSQQPKPKAKATTTVHHVKKSAVVKKPVTKKTYWGYASMAEVDEAWSSQQIESSVMDKMLKMGYVPLVIRTPSSQRYSAKQKAEMYKNQNSSPFNHRVTNNPIMY